MVEDGCRQIKEVYVVTELTGDQLAAPCGYCRQCIKEFSHDDVRGLPNLAITQSSSWQRLERLVKINRFGTFASHIIRTTKSRKTLILISILKKVLISFVLIEPINKNLCSWV